MVSATTLELVEWITLLSLAALWAVLGWLVNAARIMRTDSYEDVKKKHKEARFSTTLCWIAAACLMLGAALLIVWTDEADTTKDGGAILVQYWRWIGIGLFIFFLSWAYANYAGMRETDWRVLQFIIFFAGLSGVLSTFVINKEKLQVAGYFFTGFFYLFGAISSFRYTNIKIVGLGWNYLVWFLIYIVTPFVYYLLLIFGPEGTRVETSRGLMAIGYFCVSAAMGVVPGVIIAFTFLNTSRLSIDVMTFALLAKQKMSKKEMTELGSSQQIMDDDLTAQLLFKRH